MLVTMGGNVGVKMGGRQYESLDINCSFQMDVEDKDVDTTEKLEAVNEKINSILKKTLAKRAKMVYDSYNNELTRIKKDAGY